MFSVHCPVRGAEVLLGPGSIRSMHNTSEGILTYFQCRCGQLGWMVDGRHASHHHVEHPAEEPAASAAVAC